MILNTGDHHLWQSRPFLGLGQFVLSALERHTMPFRQHDTQLVEQAAKCVGLHAMDISEHTALQSASN
ncbi:MAG TPA: hypothetical protein DEF32_11575 [Hydrogenophaga sp.]|nr:hypothetical protein [Hydrogenophaga sp.]